MTHLKAGIDFIGVGVGAMVFNDEGKVFLSQRGEKASNERGTWEFPGGKVSFGEKMLDALKREFMEEYGMSIEIIELLAVDDHIIIAENQHWISPTFIARNIGAEPQILEAHKCSAIGWFALNELPQPLSLITQLNIREYLAKYNEA